MDDISRDIKSLSISSEDNPWKEQASTESGEVTVTGATQILDPSNPDLLRKDPGTVSIDTKDSNEVEKRDLLNEFDPLADNKESEAKRAWEASEGKPPQPQQPEQISVNTDAGPSKPSPTTPLTGTSTTIGTGFSFANIARSFSLPKVRTRSVDIAPPSNILNPDTLSTIAAQQHSRPSTPVGNIERKPEGRNDIASQPNSGSNSPRPGKGRVLKKDEPPPFDFQLFLDQMKTRSAEPVAKYLRSFLSNFAKKSLAVHDQVKVINEFLNFIAIRMRESDVWRNSSDDEFDNAIEAMEKLVMNRLYEFTFIPQLAEANPPRPITTDDLERDRILAQRIALFDWIEEKHLEVPEGPDSRGFLMFAQQELLKINHYKAPRDKLICVLNCCKVIFGLIRHLHKEENADSFIPILIYVVLKSNPPNLISNIEYIQRFRNPQKLQSETGYYLSSLLGAVQFIETMDHSGLSNITAEEFEKNVENAIHTLPTSPRLIERSMPPTPLSTSRPTTPSHSHSLSAPMTISSTPVRSSSLPGHDDLASKSPHAGEESAQPLSLSLASLGGGSGVSFADDTRRFLQRTSDAIGKPLNALGRLLGEAFDGLDSPPGTSNSRREVPGGFNANIWEPYTPIAGNSSGQAANQIATPYKPRIRQLPPGGYPSPGTPLGNTPSGRSSGQNTPEQGGYLSTPSRLGPEGLPLRGLDRGLVPRSPIPMHLGEGGLQSVSRTPTPGLDIAELQAEIDQAHARAADASLGTLMQIFPGADREVVEWVLEAEGGDLGRSIEKLLEVNGG